jgi:hypothetical protein
MRKLILWLSFFTLFLVLSIAVGCNIITSSPNQTPQPTGQQLPPTLVNTNRTIGAGGGFAEVTFSANNGQRIRITLTGSSSMMEPYGSLEYPDGMTSIYTPDLGSSLNGVNTSELILTQSGTYTYVIFDGSNIGGQINIKIEMI